MRAKCDEVNPEAVLIGEVFGTGDVLRNYLGKDPVIVNDDLPRDDVKNLKDKFSRYFKKPGLDMVFLFEFLTFKYSAEFFKNKILKYENLFPDPLQPTYVFENHDRCRLINRLNGDIYKARNLATLQLTLRGVITLYQGQEIGMENTYIPLKMAQDPIAHDYFYWIPEFINKKIKERLNRDEVRTPMQWDDTKNAGFTFSDAPWLKVNQNFKEVNVKVQQDNPNSYLSLYKELLSLRRQNSAFSGTLNIIESQNKDILLYLRESSDQKLLVCLNFSDNVNEVRYAGRKMLFSNSNDNSYESDVLYLKPNTAAVLEL